MKGRSYRYCTRRWNPNVYIITTPRWPWFVSLSPKIRYALFTHIHTSNLSLTHFFSLLWITYSHWLTSVGGKSNRKLLEYGSNHYTQTREHTEYMMAAILSNCWGCRKYFGHVTRHCTREVSIPAPGKFLCVFSDTIYTKRIRKLPCADIPLTLTVTYHATEFWRFYPYKSDFIKMKQSNT